jgi:2-(1,2-epoxy-1,2-dihydrophenyl)acetyl-CoA isomerase
MVGLCNNEIEDPARNRRAREQKTMSESETLLSSLAAGVLTLTLNRPDKLNSFNEEMHLALRAGIQRAHDDSAVRAVLLTGAGRGFCAGQDLGDRDPRKGGPAPDLGHTIGTFYNPTLRLMRALEKPIVCAVNGVAAGAGANIAFACDIVLAAKSAKFIQAFAKIGLVPDAGGTWSLARILGEPRAKALAMTAEPLPAEKAADWGLIWKAVDDADLMNQASTLAASLAAGRRLALA